MRLLPQLNYCGLTIVLSNQSRFDVDSKGLLTANGGTYFSEKCLSPEVNRYQCDIRLASTRGEGLLKDTKVILLLGEAAMKSWTSGLKYATYSLGEQRGCPLESYFEGIPAIASYLPQDAMDIQDWEGIHNPLLNKKDESQEEYEEEGDESESEVKDHGKTKRENYKFWLRRDAKRAISICKGNGFLQKKEVPQYRIYPSLNEVTNYLLQNKGQTLFLDIECSIKELNLWCIGLGFSKDEPIYVVPIFRFDGTLAYGNIHQFLLALGIAMRDNTTVCHNTMFDLFILFAKYKIPFGHNIYDTMLAHGRCFVGVEKSLGHGMSHLTWLPYHKDEGIFMPRNPSEEKKLWEYNGKDIYGMMLLKGGLDSYASTKKGLTESIKQVNESIYPYLLNTFTGIKYDQTELEKLRDSNDRMMTQILRWITILTGGMEVLPTSNKQTTTYFHSMMDYPVVSRSKTTKNPSLNETATYKLKLKLGELGVENPILDLCITYRRLQTETGKLNFKPLWNQ